MTANSTPLPFALRRAELERFEVSAVARELHPDRHPDGQVATDFYR